MKKMLIVVLAVVLVGTFTAWAGTSKGSKKETAAAAGDTMKTKVAHGKIVSATDDSLVLSVHNKLKGSKDETFVLNPSTQKSGNLEPGAMASVHYKMDGGQMVATSVKAKESKQATAKPAKAKKSSTKS